MAEAPVTQPYKDTTPVYSALLGHGIGASSDSHKSYPPPLLILPITLTYPTTFNRSALDSDTQDSIRE